MSSEVLADIDNLDFLSNRVGGLLSERRYDEALSVCQQLLNEYPDQADGLHRFAETYVAMGRNGEAAAYYRKTADFMRNHEHFEEEAIEFFMNEAEKLDNLGK